MLSAVLFPNPNSGSFVTSFLLENKSHSCQENICIRRGHGGNRVLLGAVVPGCTRCGEDLRVIKFLIKALSQHSYFYFYLANLHFIETWRLKFQSFFLGSRYTNHPAPCPLLHVFLFISVCVREREREITYRKVYIYNSFFILT